jgi:chromosome segregation ATPase
MRKKQFVLAKKAPEDSDDPNTTSGSRVATTISLFDERATINKLQGYLKDDPESENIYSNSSEEVRESHDDDEDGEEEDEDEEDEESENSEEYDDMIEKVSQKLVQTETQLRRTQGRLKEWDGKVQSLEKQLRNKNFEVQEKIEENQVLRAEVDRLKIDIVELDEGRARPSLESRLRKAVDFLKKDLSSSQEKYIASQAEVKAHRTKVEMVEEKNASLLATIRLLEKKHKEKDEMLSKCTKELREAREQSTKLTEEVAAVRDDLWRTEKIAEEKEEMMKRDIASRVKEKIRLEVREELTKEVTERTARQVQAQLKHEKDKEINALREQFKKVFKEHAGLKQQVERSADATSQIRRLEERDIPAFKAEIERLMSVVDENKKSHEIAIADLESYYRTKIQSLKEEAAKEKWEHATDIRKQMGKDRDREVNDFTQRIEALSMQTDRLLQRAEMEKEEYADQVRKRISQEKEKEIQSLTDKLESLTKESEELLQEAASDKEAYADQIRQQMVEEKKREVNKLSYRIEVLTSEKETLLKRISAFEEELSWTWKEQEKNIEQMKTSQSALKSSEDDMFKLKRKNQSLAAMVQQYRSSYEAANEELQAFKDRFRGSLLESEDTSFTLRERLQQLEVELEGARKDYSDVVNELEEVRSSYEERIAEMMHVGHDQHSETSSVQELMSSVEAENNHLKQHIAELEQLCQSNGEGNETSRRQGGQNSISSDQAINSTSHQSNQALKAEICQLNENIDEQNNLLDKYKFDVEELENNNQQLKEEIRFSKVALEIKERELAQLRETIEDTEAEKAHLTGDISMLNSSLEACQDELSRVSNELDAAKVVTKSVQETEIEAALIRNELSRVKARLEYCQCGGMGTVAENRDDANSDMVSTPDETSTGSSQETHKLNNDINNLERLIDEQRNDNSSKSAEHSSRTNEDKSQEHSSNSSKQSHDIAIDDLRQEIEFLRRSLESKEKDKLLAEETCLELRTKLQHVKMKVDELTASLCIANEERSQVQEELGCAQDENKTLLQKVQELTTTVNESREELDQVSKQLEESKERAVAEEATAIQLRERIDRLTLILETTDRNRTRDGFALEDTKKRLEDSLEEVEDLQSEVERLTDLLSATQAEVDQANQELQQSKSEFEEHLSAAEAASSAMGNENEMLRSQLEGFEAENSKVKKELLHSKRLFHEALMKSEKKIFELNNQIESLSNKADSSQNELQTVAQHYEASNNELQIALQNADSEYKEKVGELQNQIDIANTEKERLIAQLRSLENDFGIATREFENEKLKIESERRKLKEDLAACNHENLEVAKELQHSRQLFKEALIAWRVETRDLTQQLNMWRRTDHIEGISPGRDSFSVQTDYDQSTHDGSTYDDVPQGRLNDRGTMLKNGSSNNRGPKNSPRGFFSSLLSVDTTTDDDTMMTPPPTESLSRQQKSENTYISNMKGKKVTWKADAAWDLYDSDTNCSQSDRTSTTGHWDRSGLQVNTSMEEPFDEADELNMDRPARQNHATHVTSSSSSSSSAGRQSSTESRDGNVVPIPNQQRTGELPPRQPNKNHNKNIIQKLLDEESRDDVQSKDGSFFSYSSASHDSRFSNSNNRPYFQGHTSVDEDDQTINSATSSLSSVRKIGGGTVRYGTEQSSQRFSMQESVGYSAAWAFLQRQQQLQDEAALILPSSSEQQASHAPLSSISTAKMPSPSKTRGSPSSTFDEQQRQQHQRVGEEEKPFDEANPNWWHHHQQQQQQQRQRSLQSDQFISASYSTEHDASTNGNSTTSFRE